MRLAYEVQTSYLHNLLMFMASLGYTILSIWEPANSHVTEFNTVPWVMEMEMVVLSLYCVDVLLHFLHFYADIDR